VVNADGFILKTKNGEDEKDVNRNKLMNTF
jgi:hypothetical protein